MESKPPAPPHISRTRHCRSRPCPVSARPPPQRMQHMLKFENFVGPQDFYQRSGGKSRPLRLVLTTGHLTEEATPHITSLEFPVHQPATNKGTGTAGVRKVSSSFMRPREWILLYSDKSPQAPVPVPSKTPLMTIVGHTYDSLFSHLPPERKLHEGKDWACLCHCSVHKA